jgi:GMP reductase
MVGKQITASEGRVMEVPYKGKISETIEEVLGGLRSTCTYVGTTKLKDLSKCTTFIRVNRVHDNMS